jgi:hypothetical protein
MDCVICQEKHKTGLEITNCNHVFCSPCLYKWFAKKHNCPLCRGAFLFSSGQVRVKFFRTGIKTRNETRLIDEEKFILDLAVLSNKLARYHYYGQVMLCCNLVGIIINTCLKNINLFLNSTNSQMYILIKYLKNYDNQYKYYVSVNRDDYMNLMKLLDEEIKKLPGRGISNNNVIINNMSSYIV